MDEGRKRTLIVAYTLGFGDSTRFVKLGAAFAMALKEAAGRMPLPLATPCSRDAQIWAVASDADKEALFSAIMKRLAGKGFQFGAELTTPDRMMIFEVSGEGVIATDAAIKTALSMR